MLNKKLIYFLIIIDSIWAISAIVYDWDKIISIPPYFWLFVIICPVFPFLLMINWINITRGKLNQLLLAFATIPSIIYFIAALIYYPTWMILNGFDILAFGQIFWVGIYGLQGFYLLKNYKLNNRYIVIVSLFLVVSFLVQYFTNTFGLFDTTNFSKFLIESEYLFLVVILISLCVNQIKNRA